MVANDQDSNDITGHAKQEMIRKTSQVSSVNIALADRERLRSLCDFSYELLQFCVKFGGQIRTRNPLVIFHYLSDIGVNLGMKNKPHYARRC